MTLPASSAYSTRSRYPSLDTGEGVSPPPRVDTTGRSASMSGSTSATTSSSFSSSSSDFVEVVALRLFEEETIQSSTPPGLLLYLYPPSRVWEGVKCSPSDDECDDARRPPPPPRPRLPSMRNSDLIPPSSRTEQPEATRVMRPTCPARRRE